MYSDYETPLTLNVNRFSSRIYQIHNHFAEIERIKAEIEKKKQKKAFRFYKNFALDLIYNFERKISKKIVFSLNKVICRKVYKDFRFYFVRAF